MKILISYTIIIVLIISTVGCSKTTFRSRWTKEIAPPTYTARFETSKGNFDIEVTRDWSPLAADRLYQLLNHHVYDNVLFYRAVPDFVVQFGSIDTLVTKEWEKFKVLDEAVIKSNTVGQVSFARSGPNTRGNDLFINLKNNQRLDTINYSNVVGFPVLGAVVKGMNVVESIYSGYGNKTMEVYDSLSSNRTKYLELFPKLDSIKKAYILKTKKKI